MKIWVEERERGSDVIVIQDGLQDSLIDDLFSPDKGGVLSAYKRMMTEIARETYGISLSN